jgi:hypothetical protein
VTLAKTVTTRGERSVGRPTLFGMALWLYLLSDEGGSWPVLKEEPLPPGLFLCDGKVLAELFGRYEDRGVAWTAFQRLEALVGGFARPTPPDGPDPLT